MKLVPLLALAIVASGHAPAIAGTLLYEFNFSTPTDSAPQGFSYQTDIATPPGTTITGAQTLPALVLIFPLVAGRDFTGAWSFTLMSSPTSLFMWTAQEDLSFPNTPGVYTGQPAVLTTQVMFVVNHIPGTVDITIQEIPEPRTALLALTALALFAAMTAMDWRRR
jgi:hypothetical protein